MTHHVAAEAMIKAGLRLINDADTPIERTLAACDYLVRQGYFEEVEPALDRLCNHPATRADARRLLAVCKQMLSWDIQGKLEGFSGFDAVPFDPMVKGAVDVMLARRPGSSKCIVVFTGAAKQIWVSLHILHQIMPTDCHIIYLKDHSDLGYLLGLPVFGAGFSRMVYGLKSICDGLGVKEVYVLGSSAGGFAALSFGLLIGASRMLSFSPQTDLTDLVRRHDAAAMAQGDPRWRQPDILPPYLDLVEQYKNTSNPPRLVLTFGGANTADAPAALRMAGLSGVVLNEAVGYARHDILAWCFANGQIRTLIDGMMGSRTA